MNITATFSNGFTDIYKGDRSVKAAWAIVDRETGATLNSGHSLDRAKAQKTAEGNLRNTRVPGVDNAYAFTGRCTPGYHVKQAREYFGYTGKGLDSFALTFLKAHNAKLDAAKRARVTIEVVDL